MKSHTEENAAVQAAEETPHRDRKIAVQYRKDCHLEESVMVLNEAQRTFQQLKLSRCGKGYFDRW